MDREQVKWIVERLRAGADARIGGFMNSKLMHEAADALERATWPPSREQIARALAPHWFTELAPDGTHPLDNYPKQHEHFRAAAYEQADAILSLKPEPPHAV